MERRRERRREVAGEVLASRSNRLLGWAYPAQPTPENAQRVQVVGGRRRTQNENM